MAMKKKKKAIDWKKHTNFIAYLLTVGVITASAYYVYYKKTTPHYVSQLNFKEKDFIKKHKVSDKNAKILDALYASLDIRVQAILNGQPSILTNNQIEELLERKGFSVIELKRNIKHDVAKLVVVHPKLPKHIIKFGCDQLKPRLNISRLVINEQIEKLVKNPALVINQVELVKKKLHHRKGRPHDLNDFNYLVLCPKVQGVPYDRAPLLSQQVTDKINDDAFVVINYLQPKNASHLVFSLHPNNIFITPKQKVAFMDTEIRDDKFRNNILHLYFDSPNEKEKTFIQAHSVMKNEKEILDAIMVNASPKTQALFNGDIKGKTHKNIVATLQKDNFTLLTQDVATSKSLTLSHPQVPSHLIKIGLDKENPRKTISRLVYADKICSLVGNKQNNLSTVQALRKKLYQLPGKPDELVDANYAVVAPKIDGESYTKVATNERLADEVISVIWTVLLDKDIVYPKEKVAFQEFEMNPRRLVVTPENKAIFRNTCIKNNKRRKRWLANRFGWTPEPNKEDFLGLALLKQYAEDA